MPQTHTATLGCLSFIVLMEVPSSISRCGITVVNVEFTQHFELELSCWRVQQSSAEHCLQLSIIQLAHFADCHLGLCCQGYSWLGSHPEIIFENTPGDRGDIKK